MRCPPPTNHNMTVSVTSWRGCYALLPSSTPVSYTGNLFSQLCKKYTKLKKRQHWSCPTTDNSRRHQTKPPLNWIPFFFSRPLTRADIRLVSRYRKPRCRVLYHNLVDAYTVVSLVLLISLLHVLHHWDGLTREPVAVEAISTSDVIVSRYRSSCFVNPNVFFP